LCSVIFASKNQMMVFNAAIRIVVISLLAFALSILAMLTIKRTGIDLKDYRQRTEPGVLLIAAFYNLLFIVSVAAVLYYWDHEPIAMLGFVFNGKGVVFVIITFLVSLSTAFLFIHILKQKQRIDFGMNPDFLQTVLTLRFWLGLVVLFIAALQEEIMFRGYFTFVLRPFGFWWIMAISSSLFTLWHFLTNKVNFFQAIDWLVGGIMLFTIYWLSGSVWVVALVHFSRNLTNVLVFNITGNDGMITYQKGLLPQQKTTYLIICSSLVIMLAMWVF
jgi:membrane protease YdiL (CAAX protease family)